MPRKKTTGNLSVVKKSKKEGVSQRLDQLAQLSEDERRVVSMHQDHVQDQRRRLAVAESGMHAYWATLRHKYDLPEEFSYEPSTGRAWLDHGAQELDEDDG